MQSVSLNCITEKSEKLSVIVVSWNNKDFRHLHNLCTLVSLTMSFLSKQRYDSWAQKEAV